VEFVMRGHAVILAVALVWLFSIEGAKAKLDILVDKATQRMLVIQDGYVRYLWPVSTGRDNMATPNGIYAPQRLERSWFSKAYYDSPMPFSIFFHNGYAIHGSYAIDRLGGPASHGCVRLHPYHAELLFDLVQQEGPDKTTIEVTDGGRPDGPPLAGREIPPAPLSGREIASAPVLARDIPPAPVLARDIPPAPLPPREIPPGGQGASLPVPRVIHYREARDMPDPPPVQPAARLIAAKNPFPPRPPSPSRQMLTDVKPPTAVPRAPGGPGEADAAKRAPRPSNELFNSRSKPKVAEGSPEKAQPAAPVQSQAAPAQQAAPIQSQQEASVSSFKLLPASCWSGGASRWRWWASSEGAQCK
jgi:hypothetical protein